MRSLLVGSLAAAVVMFVLGFIFFGLLFPMALAPLPVEAGAALQGALGGQLTASGSYMVPMEEAAWMKGPSALIHFTAAGEVPAMPVAMALGFVHMVISALIIGTALKAVGGDFARQSRVLLWFGLAAAFYMHLGDPIWYGYGWRLPLFVFAADGLMFVAGGLVLARWFTGERAAA
jgi:hypothetical protein